MINAKTRAERDSYRIIYEGGVIGSPLQNLLHWTVSPDGGEDRPWDQMRFFWFLTDLGVPKSLYRAGKYKLANVASKPNPVAIVRRKGAGKNHTAATNTASTTGTTGITDGNNTTAAAHGASGNRVKKMAAVSKTMTTTTEKKNDGSGGKDRDEAPPEKRWKRLF
ncbi:MAG: hypothetical protein GY869_06570 [Planctomycetes bacterium]|nr:hypothetical protein [Planctomycetota bacterium]